MKLKSFLALFAGRKERGATCVIKKIFKKMDETGITAFVFGFYIPIFVLYPFFIF